MLWITDGPMFMESDSRTEVGADILFGVVLGRATAGPLE